jgi:cobyrinic acid a,c-diamide synthase
MLSGDRNRDIFGRNAAGADVCIVEGVMGLFDGASGKSEAGSTAEMAKLLGLPVVLVVDASAAARSVAALVHGFETFDPEVNILGVIFNKVAGATHADLLREAVESACGALPLGYLPQDERIQMPERYLGLFTAGEDLLPDSILALLAEITEGHINLETILESAAPFTTLSEAEPSAPTGSCVRVGVARDRAFCFYYEDNLDALRAAGAQIAEFSPLQDAALPARLDALYFGGGYPELYCSQVSANREMIAAVKKFADEGGVIYAECGGLMYLANRIVTRDSQAFSMAGILPFGVQMTDRLVNFGYAEVCLARDCFWGAAGARARGHSFHCSTITESAPIDQTYRVSYTQSKREVAEGFHIKNVLASYIHLHFLSCPGLASTFVDNVRRTKTASKAAEK